MLGTDFYFKDKLRDEFSMWLRWCVCMLVCSGGVTAPRHTETLGGSRPHVHLLMCWGAHEWSDQGTPSFGHSMTTTTVLRLFYTLR